MLSPLTSHEALQLTATFAIMADRMRAADGTLEIRAKICDKASRVAFLRAHLIAKQEEIAPLFGDTVRRAVFATA